MLAFPDIHFGLALRVADPDSSPLDNFTRKPAFDYLKTRLAAAPPLDDAGVTDASTGGADADPANPDAGTNGEQPGAPAGCGCATSGGRGRGPTSGELVLGVVALALGRRRRPRATTTNR